MKVLITTLSLLAAIPSVIGLTIKSTEKEAFHKRGFIDGLFCCPVSGVPGLTEVSTELVEEIGQFIDSQDPDMIIKTDPESCQIVGCAGESEGNIAVNFCNFQPDFPLSIEASALAQAMDQIASGCGGSGNTCGVLSSELGYTITVAGRQSLGASC